MTTKTSIARQHRIGLEYEVDTEVHAMARALTRYLADDDWLELAYWADDGVKMLNMIAHRAVAIARENGETWDQIGVKFGITRQAAQQRFKAVADHKMPMPFGIGDPS